MDKQVKKFAEGFCFQKIFIFFLIGSLFGTYYEEILWFIRNGEWVNRQGLIYTPLSPIYGLGVLFFVAILGKHNEKRSILRTYIYSFFIGGTAEYLTSFIADKAFGVKFWDYHNLFLNINGRTTIPFMIGWGFLGLVLMKVVYPLVSKLLEKIPYKIGNIIYYIIFAITILDLVITYSAFARMGMRNNGQPPLTFIGEAYDKYYNNDFMYEKFPIMKPTEEDDNWPGDTLIGHGFYAVDNIADTNSLEAFNAGYAAGIKTFEVDLSFSLDDQVILAHDNQNVDENTFLKTKIEDKYTPMTLRDLLKVMNDHADVFIITDTEYTDEERIDKVFQPLINLAYELNQEDLLNRFIIEIYAEDMYDIIAKLYPFENILFGLEKRYDGQNIQDLEAICQWAKDHELKGLTMQSSLYNDEVKKVIDTYDLNVYVHTVNDINDAKALIAKGVDGLYTDSLTLADLGA